MTTAVRERIQRAERHIQYKTKDGTLVPGLRTERTVVTNEEPHRVGRTEA